MEDEDSVRPWLKPLMAATGCGTGRDWIGSDWGTVCCARGGCWGTGLAAAGREEAFGGPPLGPPGRSSLPFVMGFPGIRLAFGVGFDREFGDSPGPVWMVPLL